MDHNEKLVLTSVLEDLGFKSIARDAIRQNNWDILKRYISLAEKTAKQLNDVCSLDRLCFAGLIH